MIELPHVLLNALFVAVIVAASVRRARPVTELTSPIGDWPANTSRRAPWPQQRSAPRLAPDRERGPRCTTRPALNRPRPLAPPLSLFRLFHQTGSGRARIFALLHDPQPASDLGISLDHAAEVLAKSVLVELVIGLDVPQPAGVRG